ncbi:carboxypeptidase-like regulatory domain-containing protein [Sphingobacterium oryzagri]|uniref:Carboxypeptidase-like regulatory domain-containing protein n=1 Tax=Sphingobacterium oryzagri TaxID=3025669 RepID=A0ABY7WMB0_9SPHI|nr:carboxypeptidase-like regulatory domain-containing protein [Sphingobacterium sp. KACC 22765]WDF69551.1 carboxypeptidase-like regulatory domain-containing protein [Sphingobacterium sp. KACC 22765]
MSNRDYNIAHIRKYVAGKLSAKEMHELERAAHADEMLMDLIQGIELEQQQQTAFPKDELTAQIMARASQKKSTKLYIWKRIAVAAALLVILSFSFYLFLTQQKSEKTLTTAARSTATKIDTMANAIAGSTTASEDSLSQDDSLGDTRLALKIPQKERPAAPIRQKADGEDKEEQLEKILADIATDTQRLAMAQAETAVPIKKSVVNMQGEQTKQSATASAPNRIRGVNTIPSANGKGVAVFGKIVDSNTEEPLAQVTIKDLVSNKTTASDDKGNFVFISGADSVKLDVQYIGYEGQQIAARTSELNIRLHPQENNLDEVVVSGYGKIEISTKSVPLTGWKAFNSYVAERAKAKNLTEGTVTLKFDLDYEGRPTHIVVDQSVDSLHDAAAIDILKNGPKWQLGKKSTDIKIKVKFKR